MSKFSDRLLTLARIVASSLGKQNGSVSVNLRVSADDDDEGEDGSTEEPLFTGPAMFRPLDPTPDGAAEAVVARVTDGLQPIAVRDLRLAKARGALGRGVTTLPGYGGAFVSVDYQAASATDTVTIYVPDDSNPKKASLAMIDKAQMVFLHKRGQYIALYDDGSIALVSADGQSFVTVSNAGVALSGPLKTVTGALFGDVVSAKPVVVAPDGAGAWFAAAQLMLTTIAAAFNAAPGPIVSGGPGTVVPPNPLATPVVSTKASASP